MDTAPSPPSAPSANHSDHEGMPETPLHALDSPASTPPDNQIVYCLCGATDPSECCGDVLARAWLSRHWHVLRRVDEDRSIPADATVAEVVGMNQSFSGAHTDLLQTLDFEASHQPHTESWLRQNGPILARALASYMETRVMLARTMEHNRDLARGLKNAFQTLHQRVQRSSSDANGADTTQDTNSNEIEENHAANDANIIVIESDSDDNELDNHNTNDRPVIIVYDSDDSDYNEFA